MTQNSRIDKIVWDEMVQAKSWEQYISEYTGNKMDWRKYLGISTIILSMIGSTTWALWRVLDVAWIDYITPALFILTAASQLISALQSRIVIDENTLRSLSKLRAMYIKYFNQLECLYLSAHSNSLSQEEITSRFFEIRESVYPIEELKDSLNIKNLKSVSEIVRKNKESHLKARWFS